MANIDIRFLPISVIEATSRNVSACTIEGDRTKRVAKLAIIRIGRLFLDKKLAPLGYRLQDTSYSIIFFCNATQFQEKLVIS